MTLYYPKKSTSIGDKNVMQQSI